MINGIVITDKPQGMTSHDVVSRLRRIYGTKRVGHTGTLDPMATGVLPVCIGSATRAADMLTASDKRYRAVMELGKVSDTLDIEGTITKMYDVNVGEDDIRRAVKAYTGSIEQTPPMYSAIKKDGKKLYELARAGITVERGKRSVDIYSIDIDDISLPFVTVSVHCSKGTYIRSLCDDIGRTLGCGAVMCGLRRTESAGFNISDAKRLEEIEKDPEGAVIPTDRIFSDLCRIDLNEKQERSVVNGVRMTWRGGEGEGIRCRVYGAKGNFLCISEIKDGRLVLVKSFWQQ